MAGRQWQQITARAAWSPRAGGVVEWYKGAVKLTATRTQQGPQMLMYGVGVWSNPEQPEDRVDVWASTNGRVWNPVYVEGDGFSPLLSAITVQDSQGRQFRIQGAEAQPPNNGVWGDVYMSTNGGSRWTLQGSGLPSEEGRFLGQAVVDSKDVIYVTMGQYAAGPLQDVWTSANQGRTWTKVRTSGALPPARAVHGSVATKFRDGTDAIYIMYGWEKGSQFTGIGNVYRNGRLQRANTPHSRWPPSARTHHRPLRSLCCVSLRVRRRVGVHLRWSHVDSDPGARPVGCQGRLPGGGHRRRRHHHRRRSQLRQRRG